MVSSIAEITRAIMENAANAAQTAEMADKNGEVAREGEEIIQQTIDKIRYIAKVIADSANTVENLGDSTQQIGIMSKSSTTSRTRPIYWP
jgi:methyl-accepting chemotaxis protein